MKERKLPFFVLLLIFVLTINFASAEVPPVPVNFSNTTGNFWINWTWDPGSGNTTDLYNVSVNGTWTNTSAENWANVTVAPHGWSNITVFAFNTSGEQNISATSYSGTKQLPNNNPVQTAIGSQSTTENLGLTITITSTDADGDTITYSTNSTYGTLTSNLFEWEPPLGTYGVYTWYFTSTDNQSVPGTDTEDVVVTVYQYIATGSGYSGGSGAPLTTTAIPTSSPATPQQVPAGILPTESETGSPTTAIYIGISVVAVMCIAWYGLSQSSKKRKPRSRTRK